MATKITMAQSKQILNFKQQNQFMEEIKKWIKQAIDNQDTAKHYYGTITKVYNDAYADVLINYGKSTSVLTHLSNKSGVVLQINDVVLLTAPFGDISDIYIDKNSNKNVLVNMEHAVGILTLGGNANTSGLLRIMDNSEDRVAMEIGGYSIDFYDFLQTGLQIGTVATDRNIDINGNKTGSPTLSMIAEQGCSAILGLRDIGSSTFIQGLEINNNAHGSVQNCNINLPLNIYPTGISSVGLEVTPTGTNIYGNSNFENGNVTAIGTLDCTNLSVTGTKNCIQSTKNFGDRLFYSYELGDSLLGDIGYGKINNGECVIAINPIIKESLNVDNSYIVKFYPDENCDYNITKESNYFVITASKNIEFGWELMGRRRGYENDRLEYANGIKNSLLQPNERNILLDNLGNENTDLLNKSLFQL